jgi:hypothetical protein
MAKNRGRRLRNREVEVFERIPHIEEEDREERDRNEQEETEEIIRVNLKKRGEQIFPLDQADLDFDTLDADINREEVMDDMDDFTDDEEILEDFTERQQLNYGPEALRDDLNRHHSKSPELSGDDLDAAWEDTDQAGEESVGGSVPTPDQDLVDELGEALGITYEDDEELATEDKLASRDRDRWELDPASASIRRERIDEDQEEFTEEFIDEDEHEEDLEDLLEEEEEDLEDELEEEDEDYDYLEDFFDEDLDDYLDELDEEV